MWVGSSPGVGELDTVAVVSLLQGLSSCCPWLLHARTCTLYSVPEDRLLTVKLAVLGYALPPSGVLASALAR